MPLPPNEDNLAEHRNVTVILRLVLDRHGQLLHGELFDVAETLQERFIGWDGLILAVQARLGRQEKNLTI